MNSPRVIAIVDDYLGLIGAFRARLAELGISYETVDQIAGWTTRYTSKLLCEEPPERKPGKKRPAQRSLGPKALDELLRVTAMRIMVVDDPEALEGVKQHQDFTPRKYRLPSMRTDGTHPHIVRRVTGVFMKKIAAKGGRARAAKMPASRRRASARKAARVRWSTPKLVEITEATPDQAPGQRR